jgi:hypothetical protein
MNKSKPDRSEIIKPALCAAGCGAPWKEWHRGCNLVFCDVHVNDHECNPMKTRIFPEQGKPSRKRKLKVVQAPQPQDLFTVPGNGNGSQVH